jgi:hypothetical protein
MPGRAVQIANSQVQTPAQRLKKNSKLTSSVQEFTMSVDKTPRDHSPKGRSWGGCLIGK